MALDNFIPEVWSARLLVNLYKSMVFVNLANRDYEGDIQQAGDTVRITSIGAVTVGDYTKNTNIGSPQVLTDAQATLTISQQKFFNFQIDDVDAAQSNIRVMDGAMVEAAYALANVADAYVAGMYADAGSTVASDAAPATLNTSGTTGTSAYERLVDLSVVLDDNNVPEDGRWVVVPPWVEGLLLKDARFVSFGTPQNLDNLQRGRIGQVSGFTVYKSNNLVHNVNGSSQDVYNIMAGHSMAISYADQINKVVAYRPEQRFADAVKGLHLYGAKVVRPQALAVLKGSTT